MRAALGSVFVMVVAWWGALATAREIQYVHRDTLFETTGLLAGTAGLLLLGAAACRVLLIARGASALSVLGAGHLAWQARGSYNEALDARVDRFGSGTIGGGVTDAFTTSTSWPLLALVVAGCAALVRSPVTSHSVPARLAVVLRRAAGPALGAAATLAAASGPLASWVYLYLDFDTDPPAPADHQGALTVVACTALLLLAGFAAVRSLGAGRVVTGLVLLGVVGQLVLATALLPGATTSPSADELGDFSLVYSAQVALWVPTSWPLMLVTLVALCRWARRRTIDTPGRQRSVSPDATKTAGPVSSTRSSTVQVTASVPPGTSTR